MAEQKPDDEAAPAPDDTVAPADTAESSPAPVDTLDKLLAEYDEGTSAAQQPAAPSADNNLDEILSALQQPDPAADYAAREADLLQRHQAEAQGLRDQIGQGIVDRNNAERTINGLQQSVQQAQQAFEGLRQQIHQAAEKSDFADFCKEQVSRLPDYLPKDYAEKWLMGEAMKDPQLRVAWDTRKIDPEAAKAELYRVTALINVAQRDPRTNPAELAQAQAYQQHCAIALHSKQILNAATARMRAAAKATQPIDAEVTANAEAVAAAVRSAGGKVSADPPPDLSRMSQRELNRYTQQFGFDAL